MVTDFQNVGRSFAALTKHPIPTKAYQFFSVPKNCILTMGSYIMKSSKDKIIVRAKKGPAYLRT
jgi:hypothetical protein